MSERAPSAISSQEAPVVNTAGEVEDRWWRMTVADHLGAVDVILTAELDALQRVWDDQRGSVAGGAEAYALEPPALLRALLLGDGKKVRPIMVLLGWIAADVDGTGRGRNDMTRAAAALEMLHCFALVHDDVMDESPTRRGQPAVHERAAQVHEQNVGRGGSVRFGDNVAVLVGDLAHSEADRMVAELPRPMRAVWQQMVLELIDGQLHDLVGSAAAERGVDFARQVARQKTGQYTVTRPLQLGAVAAGASAPTLEALAEYGRNAGEAFALRDDLLGAFGNPKETGKPAGDDLRSGKPTVLLAVAAERLRGPAARALAAAGSRRMTQTQLDLLRDSMQQSGVVAKVETMIDERVADAVAALQLGSLSAAGVARLTRTLHDLARRGR